MYRTKIKYSVVVALNLLACSASGQTPLDVSPCFNQLLQQQMDYSSSESLRYAVLSQISESTFETFKRDAKLAAYFDFLPVSASYSEFDKKRREYFESKSLQLDYYKSISLSSRLLGPQAYELISKCIDAIASKTDGFHYLSRADDLTAAAVQLFWRPPIALKEAQELEVKDSVLDNAVVVGDSADPGHLYKHAWYRRNPRIAVASPPILLTRSDSAKAIRISITTKPEVDTGFIVIPPVPRAPPSPQFQETDETRTLTQTFHRADFTYLGRGHPSCNDCDNFEKTIEVPGRIVGLPSCIFSVHAGTYVVSSCTRETDGMSQKDRARFAFYTNDGNSQFGTTYTFSLAYQVRVKKCVQNCG